MADSPGDGCYDYDSWVAGATKNIHIIQHALSSSGKLQNLVSSRGSNNFPMIHICDAVRGKVWKNEFIFINNDEPLRFNKVAVLANNDKIKTKSKILS